MESHMPDTKTLPAPIVEEINAIDPWARRARPGLLYVMYLLLLWALPLGVVAAFNPTRAQAMAATMTAYLGALPEPLYALFGTCYLGCYLGYTAARQWGKLRGVDR
jgi:hypothetical protein